MEITYKVRGADGKDYGPVTLDQLTGWLREGRLGPQSEIMRSDTDYWARAGDFEELKAALPATPPPMAPASAQSGTNVLASDALARTKGGASWFYWIAALSLINSILSISGAGIRFIFGLGITQISDAFASGLGGAGVVGLIVTAIAGGVLVLFGIFGSKGQTWAFLVGMILYGLDAVVSLLIQDWLGAAFHGWVLFRLAQGFMACREFNRR